MGRRDAEDVSVEWSAKSLRKRCTQLVCCARWFKERNKARASRRAIFFMCWQAPPSRYWRGLWQIRDSGYSDAHAISWHRQSCIPRFPCAVYRWPWLTSGCSCPVRRDARNLARGQPLSEHDVPLGTEKGVVETGRLKWPRAVGAAPGYALRVTDSAEGSTDYPTTFMHNLTHTTRGKPSRGGLSWQYASGPPIHPRRAAESAHLGRRSVVRRSRAAPA